MNLLTPAFLVFALLVIPIVLLYMLKLRRQDKVVSSTFLWQQILRDQQANAPFQRLKIQLLLLIQLLILAALVIALARPAVSEEVSVNGPTILLLDASASMNATDVSPDRFSEAKTAAQNIINQKPQTTPLTIILAGIHPRILVANETDHQKLSDVLSTAQADQGESDWEATFYLVSSMVARLGQNENQTGNMILISDGGFDPANLPEINGDLRVIHVGSQKENLGISALAIRMASDGLQLFSAVKNFGEEDHAVLFTAYGDGQVIDSRQLTLMAGQRQDILLSGLKAGIKEVNVKISSPAGGSTALDVFPLDDSATTIYQSASGGKALIVSKGNVFLQQLFARMAEIEPYILPVEDETSSPKINGSYDLVVLDGVQPAVLPETNIIWINPPAASMFNVLGSFKVTDPVQVMDHPLSQYVDWSNVHISRAEKITLPEWAEPVVQTAESPLVFAGETGGRKMVVLAFDLHDSDLPMQVPFPVLFSNIVNYFSSSNDVSLVSGSESSGTDVIAETNLAIQPGGKIKITPHTDVNRVSILLPDGSVEDMRLENGVVEFSRTNHVGVYGLYYPDNPTLKQSSFSVNLFSDRESDIRPGEISLKGAVAPVEDEDLKTIKINREYWPWLAAAGLFLVCLEWFVYRYFQHRTIRKALINGRNRP